MGQASGKARQSVAFVTCMADRQPHGDRHPLTRLTSQGVVGVRQPDLPADTDPGDIVPAQAGQRIVVVHAGARGAVLLFVLGRLSLDLVDWTDFWGKGQLCCVVCVFQLSLGLVD